MIDAKHTDVNVAPVGATLLLHVPSCIRTGTAISAKLRANRLGKSCSQ